MATMRALVLVFAFLQIVIASNLPPSDAKVEVDVYDPVRGFFRVLADGQVWFSSAEVFFRANGRIYSTSDDSLALSSMQNM